MLCSWQCTTYDMQRIAAFSKQIWMYVPLHRRLCPSAQRSQVAQQGGESGSPPARVQQPVQGGRPPSQRSRRRQQRSMWSSSRASRECPRTATLASSRFAAAGSRSNDFALQTQPCKGTGQFLPSNSLLLPSVAAGLQAACSTWRGVQEHRASKWL
jgi:hypothetical protein